MTLRARLLSAFIATAVAVTVIFGVVAYRIADDHAAAEELDLIRIAARSKAYWFSNSLGRRPVSEALRTLSADPGEPTLATVLVARDGTLHTGGALSPKVIDQIRKPLLAELKQKHGQGRLIVGDKSYLWGASEVPGKPYRLVLVHIADEVALGPFQSFGARLIVVGFLVLWFAVWGGLILSGYISRRLNEQNARLVHQALHDDLTGLPNRRLFFDRLLQAILYARRRQQPVVLMVMDLSGFREINDTLGHQEGDDLLKQIGPRMQEALRSSDTIARLGGDDFAILLPETSLEEARICADKLLQVFSRPFALGEISIRIGASFGITAYPQHSEDPEVLIQQAEVALNHAKTTQQDVVEYARDLDTHSLDRLTLLSDLQKSIENDQLVFYYQPKISIRTRQIMGVEALVRWSHPERGLVSPGQFIPLAEQTGFIRPMTYWGVEQALHQCRAWCRQDLRISVAVNISTHCLQDSRFSGRIIDTLRESGLGSNCLEFEITESAIMVEPERAKVILGQFRALGITISIDDFGTGFTSLSYLRELPVDKIKIDRSFVANMLKNERDATIVRSVIDLAHNMGYQVVAEGVEDEKIWAALEQLDCDLIQGYFVARPMVASALEQWVSQSQWKMVANF